MAAATIPEIIDAKRKVLDVAVSTISYREVVEQCNSWIESLRANAGAGPWPARARYICFLSVHGLMEARSDSEVRHILNDADIVAPDGMPVVWALRSFGARHQARVYGPDAMSYLCREAARRGHRIFLYGGTEESLRQLSRNLERRFPGIEIVDAYAPPFRPLTEAEDRDVTARIRESGADLVFVGISTPKQERWMYQHRDRLPGIVMAGVGAAFDFHAGRVRQAPPWMQSHGLEWMFRLVMEPCRLWRRYLLVTPRFLPLWAAQWAALTIRRISPGRLPDGADGQLSEEES